MKYFFVTSVIPNGTTSDNAIDLMLNICNYYNAEHFVVPTRPITNSEPYCEVTDELMQVSRKKDKRINNNLKILSLQVDALLDSPFASVKNTDSESFILPHTKQDCLTLTTNNTGKIRRLWGTGCLSEPIYPLKTQRADIAQKHHVVGGLLVCRVNADIYHVCNVQFVKNKDGKYETCIWGKKFIGEKVIKNESPIATIWGDLHFPNQNRDVVELSGKSFCQLKSKNLVLHDWNDCEYLSSHQKINLPPGEKGRLLNKDICELIQYLKNLGVYDKTWFVESNHPNWALKAFGDDYINRLGVKDAIHLINFLSSDKNIFEMAFGERYVKADQNLKLGGFQCATHGHIGTNGFRNPSLKSLHSHYLGSVTGHTHTSGVHKRAVRVGHLVDKSKMSYLNGASSWDHANVHIYENGCFHFEYFIEQSDGSYSAWEKS